MPSPVNFILKRRVMHLHAALPTAASLARFGRSLPPLWPAHCLVCREPCPAQSDPTAIAPMPNATGLCACCRLALPWNRSACARCALPMPMPTAACGRCLRRPPPLTEARAAFVYGPPLDRLLPRLKFHDDLAAGRLLAGLMAEEFARMRECDAVADVDTVATSALGNVVRSRPDALVPLPLHHKRLRSRGYDQALELAKPLAHTLRIPLLDDALVRVRETAPQSRLDAPARRRNLRRAFAVRPDATLPAHVALIDDVMTTGATLHAAADALLRAGVTRVDAWVCARVA